jgi:hypothetical protein
MAETSSTVASDSGVSWVEANSKFIGESVNRAGAAAPLRSWLFVPGDSERKQVKALAGAADALILDLEDSVDPAHRPQARVRVANLLATYNSDSRMTPALDRRFETLAHERAAAHPLRTFFWIPVERALVIWFTPRVDVLRYSGELWPLAEARRANPAEFDVTLFFGLLNFVYAGLALAGAWRFRSNPGCAVLILYLLIRTVLLTQLPTVEPRYVVVCFPAVAALGALAFANSKRDDGQCERGDSLAASGVYDR